MDKQIEQLINNYISLSRICENLKNNIYAQHEDINGQFHSDPLYPVELESLEGELAQKSQELEEVYKKLVEIATKQSIVLAKDLAAELEQLKQIRFVVCQKEIGGVYYLCVAKNLNKASASISDDIVVDADAEKIGKDNTRCILFNTKNVNGTEIPLYDFLDENVSNIFNKSSKKNDELTY